MAYTGGWGRWGGGLPERGTFSGFSGLVTYAYLKEGAFTAHKRDTAVYVNNGCTKEVLFLSKIVYKRVRGWTSGWSLPI